MQRLVFIGFCLISSLVVNPAFSSSCLNAGTWNENENRCHCKPKFDGPRCERIKFSLSREGHSLLPDAVRHSESFHLSFRLISHDKKGNGSVLSIAKKFNSTHKTVLVIGLIDGHPSLVVNQFKPLNKISNIKPLNEDKWFRIHVTQDEDNLTLIIEACETGLEQNWGSLSCNVLNQFKRFNGTDFNMTDATVCLGHCNNTDPFGITKIETKHAMLENSLEETCIAELFVNDVLQNMNLSDQTDGCDDKSCGYNSKQRYGLCGKNAICYGKNVETDNYFCECKYGFASTTSTTQSQCDIKTSSFNLSTNSNVEWKVSNSRKWSKGFFNFYEVQFRTLKKDGNLISMISTPTIEKPEPHFVRLKIENGILKFKTIRNFEYSVPNINVSNGKWNTLRMRRVNNLLQIILKNNHTLINRVVLLPKYMYIELEGEPESRSWIRFTTKVQGEESFEGCMTDVKMLPSWSIFPMQENRTFELPDEKQKSMKEVIGVYISSMNATHVKSDPKCAGYTLDHCRKHAPCREDQISTVHWRLCGCKCNDTEKFDLPNGNKCIFKKPCDAGPCKNNGTCQWNGTSFEDRNVTCICINGYSGYFCGIPPPAATQPTIKKAGFDWWWIIVLCALILLLILLLLVFIFLKKRRRRDADAMKVLDERYDVDQVYENTGHDDVDGAGEEDFTGEINFLSLRNPKAPGSVPIITPTLPLQFAGFDPTPLPSNWKNPNMENDDHLDHPLEYGYEGAGSSVDLSSIVSGSTDRDLDLNDLENWGSKFRGLSQLYR